MQALPASRHNSVKPSLAWKIVPLGSGESATAFHHTYLTYDISSSPAHEVVHEGGGELSSYVLANGRSSSSEILMNKMQKPDMANRHWLKAQQGSLVCDYALPLVSVDPSGSY